MNSLYKSLMGNRNVGFQGDNRNQNTETAKSIFSMLNGSSNPYQLLINIAAKNPILIGFQEYIFYLIKNIMDSADKSGKSYQDMFYELAKQRGVDPDNIINQLKF